MAAVPASVVPSAAITGRRRPTPIPRNASVNWLRSNTRICAACLRRRHVDSFGNDGKGHRNRRCAPCSKAHVPIPWEARRATKRIMRRALEVARLLLSVRDGLRTTELAARLAVTERTAYRLLRAAELAGWPLVKDDDHRWRLA